MNNVDETKYEEIVIDNKKYLVKTTHRIDDHETSISSHVSLSFYKRVGGHHSFLPLRKPNSEFIEKGEEHD